MADIRSALSRKVSPLRFGFFARMRLRYKLALILTVAALLPVVGASTVAVRLIFAGLRSGAKAQTERTVRVALNLFLGHVKQVFEDTSRLSELSGLADKLTRHPADVEELISREESRLMPGLVEVVDLHGSVIARRIVGGHRFGGAPLPAEVTVPPNDYSKRVTIQQLPDEGPLVVRAIAPIVDAAYQLRGAVRFVSPLDFDFADRLKAQLSADIVLYRGARPVDSSFISPDGHREPGFAAPAEAAAAVLRGRSVVVDVPAFDRMFSVGFAPIQDLDGRKLGMIAVAVDVEAIAQAKVQAWRSLALGGVSAVVFALALAAILSRRLTRPLGHLHAGALAVARGDLAHHIDTETGDEIGDLAAAFRTMTQALRENQERLAERVREITTLHNIGSAVSSVLSLDEVLRRIVEEIAEVLSAQQCCLLVVDERGQWDVGAGVGVASVSRMVKLAESMGWSDGAVIWERLPVLVGATADPALDGSLLSVPLAQKDVHLGMLLVYRDKPPFSDANLRLVSTFAQQASAAISNARLYQELHQASTQLEESVQERTVELVIANRELTHALDELRNAQAALIHSERMAGLGQLVAGVAHEINSPAAAIQGAVDNLLDVVERLAKSSREVGEIPLDAAGRHRFFSLLEELGPRISSAQLEAPTSVRRHAKETAAKLEKFGLIDVESACRSLVELGVGGVAESIAELARQASMEEPTHGAVTRDRIFSQLVRYVEHYAYFFRNAHAIRTAIHRVTRIVGGLKGYSHLDQAKIVATDLHEGIENTLIILQSELKYGIKLERKFSLLPRVPVFVDELNQVWTNLIHNAVQALGGKGRIVIETRQEKNLAVVTVEDNGPGIPEAIQGKIFEPFFTTKPKGEGTGLGLGIVRQIIDKHQGRIEVESEPGRTRFTVFLPVDGPILAVESSSEPLPSRSTI